MSVGCPNHLVAEDSRSNFLDYFHYGNHITIAHNISEVMKTMNKEDRNSYLMTLSSILARLIPDMKVTPQDLIIKHGKNDRLIWDGSFMLFYHSVCANMLMNQQLEPSLEYGSTWDRNLSRIWELRIIYPNEDILLMDDDVKGAFRHSKYHPDIAEVFSFIILTNLFIPTGGTFGSTTSPANFDPYATARTFLAQKLSRNENLIATHQTLLDKVNFSPVPPDTTTYVKAVSCPITQAGVDRYNSSTTFNMFVDDSLYADIRENMSVIIAASIESFYMVLGYPDLTQRQSCLSLDKFDQTSCSY